MSYFVLARNPHANNAYQKALLLAYTPPQRNEYGDCVMMAGCRIEFVSDKSQWDILPRECRIIGQEHDPLHPFRCSVAYRRAKGLFHLMRVPVSEGSHQTCYGVFMKEVSSSKELVRSADKGELMGKYQDRYEARDKIDELARPYGEYAIFE